MRGMGALSNDERPIIGQVANDVRAAIEQALENAVTRADSQEIQAKIAREKIDVTMPGTPVPYGKKHPVAQVLEEVCDIFVGMGFFVAQGPEVEFVHYNFDALNAPKNHPSRDPQDTFYISDDVVLRTQTSPMQVRVMERQKPPIRVISPAAGSFVLTR